MISPDKSVLSWLVALLFLVSKSEGEATTNAPTNIVRQVAPGILQIGKVRVEAAERRIVIPATVNMVEGPIEYLLVSSIGKLHESVLKTEADPIHIHTAALLLRKDEDAEDAGSLTNTPPLVRITIELPKPVPAESLVLDTTNNKALAGGDWSYEGSRLVDGIFIAQRDGSIISIISDPDSLIQSGRVQADDDDRWRPFKANLPPVGTPVKVLLQFPKTNRREPGK